MIWKSKFHKPFYKIETEITIGDLAKIVYDLGEPVEKYVAKFRTARTKFVIVTSERDCVRLL